MHYFKKAIDYILNRSTGIYRGYLSPKSPKQFTVPLFVEIGKNIPSIAELIRKNIWKINDKFKFKRPLIVADSNTWEIAGNILIKELDNAESIIIKSNNITEVEKIKKKGIRLRYFSDLEDVYENPNSIYDERYGKIYCGLKRRDVFYAVGGGSVIDAAQYAAYQLNLPFISIPTSLSNDGFASPFSVLNLNEEGVQTLKAHVPLGVVVDIALVKSNDQGYKRRIRSGIGDLLSNITAIFDWELAEKRGLEEIDPIARYQSFNGAKLTIEEILKKEEIFEDDDFLEILAASLIFSAEAIGRYNSSRPASGFEHKLYHMYNAIMNYQPKATHGELVAVGTLISSYAHDNYFSEFKQVFKKVGLPTTGPDLKNINVEKKDLIRAIEKCSDFRRERYTILEEKGVDYMINCVDKVFE